MKNMKVIASLILAGALFQVAAAPTHTFTGVITDSMCGADHAAMKMSPDSRCVQECVRQGSKYALYDGKNTYTLNDQKTPSKFAAQKVKVVGVLDAKTKTLDVKSIQPAK